MDIWVDARQSKERVVMSQRPVMRVGAVNYLNSKPLVYGLGPLAPAAQLVFDLPSRLADRLADRQLEVALIPSIEFFRNPKYTVVSDACIACRGPVLSVKLLCRVPPDSIRRLAVDEGSRTSGILAQVLLAERFAVHPAIEQLPIGAGLKDCDCDAVLLIGDRAIHGTAEEFVEVWDLGEEWCRFAELPFVFAMWVAHGDVELGDLGTALSAARDSGVAHIEEIAAAEAPGLGLTPSQCGSYLRDNLHFTWGAAERKGFDRFWRLATQHGLLPEGAVVGRTGHAPV